MLTSMLNVTEPNVSGGRESVCAGDGWIPPLVQSTKAMKKLLWQSGVPERHPSWVFWMTSSTEPPRVFCSIGNVL